MLDYRIHTFLTLYETMNYHRAAEVLNLSQPAVTQQIRALEREYGCKLFHYDGRRLSPTKDGELLSVYAHASLYNDQQLRRKMKDAEPETLRIGATKTIGEYVLGQTITAYLADPSHTLSLLVDNTQRLLAMLDNGEMDFAIVEGPFDKSKYGFRLMRKEPFVGICAAGRSLAGAEVEMDELLCNTLILREQGSGTRAIFEQVLRECGRAPQDFARLVCISNFSLICRIVAAGEGISFVYQAIAQAEAEKGIALFHLKGISILREFNFVFLPGTESENKIQRFLRPEAERQHSRAERE